MGPSFVRVGRTYAIFPAPSPTVSGLVTVMRIDAAKPDWIHVRERSDETPGASFWIYLSQVRQIVEIS